MAHGRWPCVLGMQRQNLHRLFRAKRVKGNSSEWFELSEKEFKRALQFAAELQAKQFRQANPAAAPPAPAPVKRKKPVKPVCAILPERRAALRKAALAYRRPRKRGSCLQPLQVTPPASRLAPAAGCGVLGEVPAGVGVA